MTKEQMQNRWTLFTVLADGYNKTGGQRGGVVFGTLSQLDDYAKEILGGEK